jgi:simple sugar transport system permease protein
MTAGRGFIALAALVLVGWRPLPLLAACLVFGAVQSLQLVFQGVPIMGTVWPSEVWAAMPYAVTLLALAGFAGSTKPPAGLGVQ